MMDNRELFNKWYEYDGDESVPFFTALSLKLQLFFCPHTREIERFDLARELLKDSFPTAPDMQTAIMSAIENENVFSVEQGSFTSAESLEEMDFYHWLDYGPQEQDNPGGISTRAWAVTGIVILISLATSFLGFDFAGVAAREGAAFLLPVGLIFGAILTAYGALFIGSHLKELSERFGLH